MQQSPIMALKSLNLLVLFLSVLMVAQLYEADAQTQIVGGYTPADPKDPNVVAMGKFAVSQHNKEAKAALKFITVITAETQVVAGMNYRMSISAEDTTTRRINTYRAIVYAKAGSHSLQLTSFELVRVLGGWTDIDNLKDPDVVKVAKFAVAEHNKQTGSSLKYVTIVKGEKQVVAGMNYNLILTTKDNKTGAVRNYRALVYVRAWEDIYQLRAFDRLLQ